MATLGAQWLSRGRFRVRRFERGANFCFRKNTFAQDAPVIIAKIDDRRSQATLPFLRNLEQRQAIAELLHQLLRALEARRESGNICAGAGHGTCSISITPHATLQFAQRSATRPVFAVTFSGSLCEASTSSVSAPGQNFVARRMNGVGNIAHHSQRLLDGIHEDRQRASLGPSLNSINLFDRGKIERIRSKSIERVGGNSDYLARARRNRRRNAAEWVPALPRKSSEAQQANGCAFRSAVEPCAATAERRHLVQGNLSYELWLAQDNCDRIECDKPSTRLYRPLPVCYAHGMRARSGASRSRGSLK